MTNQNKVSTPANLIIKLNDNPIPNLCPLCQTETNPNIGAELFLENTESVVCMDCAEQHAPILAGLITFADLSRVFQVSEDAYGEKWHRAQEIRRIPKNSFGIQSEVRSGN